MWIILCQHFCQSWWKQAPCAICIYSHYGVSASIGPPESIVPYISPNCYVTSDVFPYYQTWLHSQQMSVGHTLRTNWREYNWPSAPTAQTKCLWTTSTLRQRKRPSARGKGGEGPAQWQRLYVHDSIKAVPTSSRSTATKQRSWLLICLFSVLPTTNAQVVFLLSRNKQNVPVQTFAVRVNEICCTFIDVFVLLFKQASFLARKASLRSISVTQWLLSTFKSNLGPRYNIHRPFGWHLVITITTKSRKNVNPFLPIFHRNWHKAHRHDWLQQADKSQ